MKSFRTFLEMAVPTKDITTGNWYHGTTEEGAKKIIQDGYLKPSEIVTKKSRGYMAPAFGRVYLYNDLQRAIDTSSFVIERTKKIKDVKYGYVVTVKGSDLKDIFPDEDTIADTIAVSIEGEEGGFNPKWSWLPKLAKEKLPELYDRYVGKSTKSYDVHKKFNIGTLLGKKLIPYLTDEQILFICSRSDRLAHEGKIPIYKVEKYDSFGKLENTLYKRD